MTKLLMKSKGQSLFEVMFAIAIASIIMVSVVSLSKRTVSSSDFSRNNALASKYALEGTEWIREQRDSEDWDTEFYLRASDAGSTIMLGNLNDWDIASPIPYDTRFSRNATLTRVDLDGDGGNGNESVEAEVIVTWEDGKGMHQVKNISRYSNWNL